MCRAVGMKQKGGLNYVKTGGPNYIHYIHYIYELIRRQTSTLNKCIHT